MTKEKKPRKPAKQFTKDSARDKIKKILGKVDAESRPTVTDIAQADDSLIKAALKIKKVVANISADAAADDGTDEAVASLLG